MNIYQCQNWAKKNGFDSAAFTAIFPAGEKRCQWVDAYFGFFTVDGLGDGFITVETIDEMFPDLVCTPITTEKEQ